MGTPKARTSGIMFEVMPPGGSSAPAVFEFLVTLGSSDPLIDPDTGNFLITQPH